MHPGIDCSRTLVGGQTAEDSQLWIRFCERESSVCEMKGGG